MNDKLQVNLNELDEDQRRAASAPRGPVCILAGAGTGKTRTITYRLGHLVQQGFVNPRQVLAVTFTTRAAGEMRDRLNHMGVSGVQARTFHSAAMRQLKYFWPQIAGSTEWQLANERFPMVANAVRSVGLENNVDMIRDVLGEIDWAKSSLASPAGYEAALAKTTRKAPADPAKVAQAYYQYEQMKLRGPVTLLDFNDLLIHVAGALENSPGVAEEFRQQYRSFVVDEYQDVTPLQQRVLDAWLGERDDLTVVGDANQTIYSFNGATPDFLLNFSRKYPHAAVVKLQRDYRSTPEVTNLANTVISKAKGRVAGTRLELQGMRPAGPEPSFDAYESEEIEAKEVAGKVLTLLNQGVPAREIAVLYRINAQSEAFEQALSDAGVVYQVRGGIGFFSRAEIVEALKQLSRAAQRTDLPNDPLRVTRAALAPLGYSSQEPEGAQARERWQSLKALVDLVEMLVNDIEGIDLRGVVQELYRRAEDRQNPSVDGVTLASLHAAKGLEWDAVFLVGLNENMLPITHAIKSGDPEKIEEERRLFYVGITRARVHLHCSWSLAKTTGSRATRSRTRFLDGVVPDLPQGDASPSSRTKRPKRCRVCNGPLNTPAEKVLARHETCEADFDEDVFEALRAWRLDTAKENNVPAYVVFSDATLLAIAEALPEDESELTSVSGVGPAKLEAYGAEVLHVVRNHRSS